MDDRGPGPLSRVSSLFIGSRHPLRVEKERSGGITGINNVESVAGIDYREDCADVPGATTRKDEIPGCRCFSISLIDTCRGFFPR